MSWEYHRHSSYHQKLLLIWRSFLVYKVDESDAMSGAEEEVEEEKVDQQQQEEKAVVV